MLIVGTWVDEKKNICHFPKVYCIYSQIYTYVGFDKTPKINFIQHQRSSNYTNTFAYYRDIACIMVFRNKLILSKITNFSRQHHLITFLLNANENFIYKKNGRICPEDTDASGSCHRKQRHNYTTEKVEKSEIEFGLPFMVPDLVQRFQMIF